ncbi:MAG: hypothetical protein AAFV53_40995 [Myxococcota bacterium]
MSIENAAACVSETLDGESGLSISLHTFGDNDCAHTDIALLIEIEMIQRERFE